jgi:hypothetical protein
VSTEDRKSFELACDLLSYVGTLHDTKSRMHALLSRCAICVLVATNVKDIKVVINYDFPRNELRYSRLRPQNLRGAHTGVVYCFLLRRISTTHADILERCDQEVSHCVIS